MTAIPSFAAVFCGAQKVIATDLPLECELMQANINYNLCKRNSEGSGPEIAVKSTSTADCGTDCPVHSGTVTVQPLDWSNLTVLDREHQRFDYVLAGDIVYEGTWELLVNITLALLRPGALSSIYLVKRAYFHRYEAVFPAQMQTGWRNAGQRPAC